MKSKYLQDVIYLHKRVLPDVPPELKTISEEWTNRSNAGPDEGSRVLGAGFMFKYNKQWYFMPPNCRHQGSVSWERHREPIHMMLCGIGATDIRYDWGVMA